MDESVLYRPFGDMTEQLAKLIECAKLPNVVIQIMPHAVTDHPGVRGPMTVLEFKDSPSVAYAEGWGSGRLIESAGEIATALACYDLIRTAALSQGASLALIRKIGGSK